MKSVYGVEEDKVLHIHGNVEKGDELIFGHGRVIKEEPEFDEHGESNRSMFSDAEGAAKYPIYALKKPVDDVLERHRDYFEKLTDISEIVVIGHSLSEVDLPYFKRISDCAPEAKWKVSYFSDEEKSSHVKTLVSCGIKCTHIDACTYDEL